MTDLKISEIDALQDLKRNFETSIEYVNEILKNKMNDDKTNEIFETEINYLCHDWIGHYEQNTEIQRYLKIIQGISK